jgi:uncharacterized protein YbjT (DUF2867 family)
MKVLIIGANGKVGRQATQKLAKHGHHVLAMLREKAQAEHLTHDYITPVFADLEKDISHAFEGRPDAVVFTAGSGANTSSEKTIAVDLQGAKKAIDESVKHNVQRFIMVSALGTNQAEEASESMRNYFVAKSEADQYLVQSALNYTILRPGRLTDAAGDGNVEAAEQLADTENAETSRDHVASAIQFALENQNTTKKVVELINGKTPINKALAQI